MICKNCRTCEFYTESIDKEVEQKDSKVRTFSAWCNHELSQGQMTSHQMVYFGPCGREMRLWKRKPKYYTEIETQETD